MPRKPLNPTNQASKDASRRFRTLASRINGPATADGLTADARRLDELNSQRANTWESMKALMERIDNETATPQDVATYEAAERVYDSLTDEIDQLEEKVDAALFEAARAMAAAGPSRETYEAGRPLVGNQTMVGAVRALGWDRDSRDLSQMRDEDGRDLSLQAVLRNGLNNGTISNAMSGASGGAGGYLIPRILGAEIIDAARAQARVTQAGARIVPMENRTVDVARWLTDPTASWRAENAAIGESDASLGLITLTAKTLAVIVRVSREAVEDTELETELTKAFGASFALAFDYASLYGPTGGDGPVGLKNVSTVTKTPLATNGATPTWDNLVDSVGRLRDVNEYPNAQILSDRTARTLAKIKDSNQNYVGPPAYLDEVQRLTTAQVPNNLTVGTSSNCSDIFTGDWSQLLLGVRTDITVTALKERYMDAGQIGFVCWFRGDVQVARPAAFDIVTGVRP